jgi:hypothetical protein
VSDGMKIAIKHIRHFPDARNSSNYSILIAELNSNVFIDISNLIRNLSDLKQVIDM